MHSPNGTGTVAEEEEAWESDDDLQSEGSSAPDHDLLEYGIYPQLDIDGADTDAAAYLRSVRCASFLTLACAYTVQFSVTLTAAAGKQPTTAHQPMLELCHFQLEVALVYVRKQSSYFPATF